MLNKITHFNIKEITPKGIITMYVNAFNNVDSDGDISLPGSFAKTLQERFNRLRWFLNHDRHILLGVPVKGEEDNYGLLMTAQLNMNKQVGRDVYEDYKLYSEHGRSLEHSIGVEPIKWETQREEGDRADRVRRVSEWRLWEFSTLTSWGANERALTVGVKELDIETMQEMLRRDYSDERLQALEERIKELQSQIQASQPASTTDNEEPPSTPVIKRANIDELFEIFKGQLKENY